MTIELSLDALSLQFHFFFFSSFLLLFFISFFLLFFSFIFITFRFRVLAGEVSREVLLGAFSSNPAPPLSHLLYFQNILDYLTNLVETYTTYVPNCVTDTDHFISFESNFLIPCVIPFLSGYIHIHYISLRISKLFVRIFIIFIIFFYFKNLFISFLGKVIPVLYSIKCFLNVLLL